MCLYYCMYQEIPHTVVPARSPYSYYLAGLPEQVHFKMDRKKCVASGIKMIWILAKLRC